MVTTESDPVSYNKDMSYTLNGSTEEHSIAGLRVHPSLFEEITPTKFSTDVEYDTTNKLQLFDMKSVSGNGEHIVGIATSESSSYDLLPVVSISRDSPYMPDISDLERFTDDIIGGTGVYMPTLDIVAFKREVAVEHTVVNHHYILKNIAHSGSKTLKKNSIQFYPLADEEVFALLPEKYQKQVFCAVI